MALNPHGAWARRLVDEQIARNRTSTILIAVVAVLNAAIVAGIVVVVAGRAAALVCLLLIAAVISAMALFAEGLILRQLGARHLRDDEFPQLRAVVKRLAGELGIPVPALYIADDAALNAGAFTVGQRAFVIYTAGLLETLDERELTAVTAHELAHIVNRGTRVSGVSRNLLGWAILVGGAVAVVATLLDGRGSTAADRDDSRSSGILALTCTVAAAMVFAFGLLWFAVAFGAHLALSRQREFMADATAARITGDREGLCRALAKIADNPKIEGNPEPSARGVLVKSQLIMAESTDKPWWRAVTSTHPSTDWRIARLRRLPDIDAAPIRGNDMAEPELERRLRDLSELHTNGALTDEEFAAAKATVLGQPRPVRAPFSHPTSGPGPAGHTRPVGPGDPGGGAVGPGPAADRDAVDVPDERNVNVPLARPTTVLTGQQAGHGGAVTSGIGGLLTLLAFLAMPMATAPFFGSITGSRLASFSSEFGPLGLLWLVPLAGVAVVGIAAWQVFGTASTTKARRTGSIAIMALAGLTIVDYIIVLTAIESENSSSGRSGFGVSAANFIGAGFWFAVIGMAVALIGARVEMQSYRSVARDGDFWSGRL